MQFIKIFFISLIILICPNLMTAEEPSNPNLNLLVFSNTAGFRHESISSGIKALSEIAQEKKWIITFTEDANLMEPSILKRTDVVIFLMTSETILNTKQKAAFKQFIQNGGGFFGIHSGGTDTEKEWEWFSKMNGAHFEAHPPVCEAKLIIENLKHPATACFKKETIQWVDEIYSFDRNPREDVEVLISVDESSYDTNNNPWFEGKRIAMGDHPLVWCKLYDGGRVIQSALGHTNELYDLPLFREHLTGSILWAADKK